MFGFENFGKKRNWKITSLKDERLIMVDPSRKDFFNNVLNYSSENEDIQAFVEAVKEVKAAKLSPFWKPIYDPSTDGENIIFAKGAQPLTNRSFSWWTVQAKHMPTVKGKRWSVGTKEQYIAFLVWLINELVKSNWTIVEAIEAVVLDSEELGIYYNSRGTELPIDETGTCMICGCGDLATRFKLLRCPDGGFYEVGGSHISNSYKHPLVHMAHCDFIASASNLDTAWLIIS